MARKATKRAPAPKTKYLLMAIDSDGAANCMDCQYPEDSLAECLDNAKECVCDECSYAVAEIKILHKVSQVKTPKVEPYIEKDV